MLVEPGFFRTELLSTQSTRYAKPSIEDYAERTLATVAGWQSKGSAAVGAGRPTITASRALS